MNKLATVRVHGNASTGIAENMMSGLVVVEGSERAAKITTESDFALVEALSIFRE